MEKPVQISSCFAIIVAVIFAVTEKETSPAEGNEKSAVGAKPEYNDMSTSDEMNYGEQLYNVMFDIVGNKKNAGFIESLRGENAVLTCLLHGQEALHPGELAERLSLVPGRMADILKTLEKKGMIRRDQDPADRRRVLVRITPKGARSVTERREQIRGQYSGLYQALGEEDTVKLIALLRKMSRYFEEM